jgi:hypothetical protein
MATTTVRVQNTEEPEWAVWLTVAVALIAGLLLQMAASGSSQTATANGTTLAFPSGWSQTKEEGADVAAMNVDGGPFGERVSARQVPVASLVPTSTRFIDPANPPSDIDKLKQAATNWSLQRGKDLASYRVLSISDPIKVKGHDAVNVESAYVTESSSLGGSSGSLPGVMHMVDTIVLSGDKFHILSFAAESSLFPTLKSTHDRLLDKWQLP